MFWCFFFLFFPLRIIYNWMLMKTGSACFTQAGGWFKIQKWHKAHFLKPALRHSTIQCLAFPNMLSANVSASVKVRLKWKLIGNNVLKSKNTKATNQNSWKKKPSKFHTTENFVLFFEERWMPYGNTILTEAFSIYFLT